MPTLPPDPRPLPFGLQAVKDALGFWTDPKNASVMDPPGVGPLRKLVGVLGLNDPNTLLMMAGGEMPVGPSASLGRLAIDGLAARFPRLAEALAYKAPVVAGKVAQPFFSRLDEAAATMPKQTFAPKIAGVVQKGLASQEELAARDVPAFLAAAGNKPIQKAALLQHLEDHPVPLVDVVERGGPTGSVPRVKSLEDGYALQPMSHEDQFIYGIAPADGVWHMVDEGGDTVGAPVTAANREEALTNFHAAARDAGLEPGDVGLVMEGPGHEAKFESYTVPGGSDYRNTMLVLQPHPDAGTFYAPSGHAAMSPDNTLAWSRSKTRVAPELGGKGTFLEEVQSDWHQKGKESGYQPGPNAPERKLAQERLSALEAEHTKLADAKSDALQALKDYRAEHGVSAGQQHWDAEYRALIGRHSVAEKEMNNSWTHVEDARARLRAGGRIELQPGYRLNELLPADLEMEGLLQAGEELPAGHRAWELVDRHGDQAGPPMIARDEQEALYNHQVNAYEVGLSREEMGQYFKNPVAGVPDAPFKESWPDLVLKHHLASGAADPETSWLGFTTGARQAEHYDLSKHVSEITWRRPTSSQPSGHLTAYGPSGQVVLEEMLSDPTKLVDYIGKDAAKKLLEQPEKAVVGPNPWMQSLSGVDLKVGGEGMRHFYDEKLPARLGKIVKPFGGVVEQVGVPLHDLTESQLEAEIDNIHVPHIGHAVFDAIAANQGTIEGKVPFGSHRTLRSREWFGEQASKGFLPAEEALEDRGVVTTLLNGGLKEPAWVVRLTPAIKERILKYGLPLMGVAGAAAATEDAQ